MAKKAGRSSREDQIQERRKSLLEAAVTVIAQKGLTGLTMNDIARQAGCSYGVASFHFKSKEGIILAALDHMVAEYDEALDRPGLGHGSPAARLKAMVDLDFDARISNGKRVAVWSAFWAESARNPEYQRRCAQLKARYHAFVKAEVSALARERKIRLDPELVARTLNAVIDGYWISNQVRNTGPTGQKAARKACLAYLRSIFPDDF